MWAALLTSVWYAAATIIAARRSAGGARWLLFGSLPILWITLCATAGFLATTLSMDARWTLGACALITCALAVRSPETGLRLTRPRWSLSPERVAGAVALACAVTVLAYGRVVEPWGGWDAVFTWVLRGRFLFLDGERWTNAFSPDLALLHPDYPPSWAGLWRRSGGSMVTQPLRSSAA
jgi:hypothetical protein